MIIISKLKNHLQRKGMKLRIYHMGKSVNSHPSQKIISNYENKEKGLDSGPVSMMIPHTQNPTCVSSQMRHAKFFHSLQ
jgi:hypothetical protein